eukprot:8751190-Heterocapsa_arctica.AAC.1
MAVAKQALMPSSAGKLRITCSIGQSGIGFSRTMSVRRELRKAARDGTPAVIFPCGSTVSRA